uniref:MULE domain-containing protein n=1 Tax=Romanomermis culicivorax TaxID=13658 RepID=A0A915HSP2_ROMCU
MCVRAIPSLAFVPQHEVEAAFDQLIEQENFRPESLPIANYFEDIYIGRGLRRGRQIPSFRIELWNLHQRSLNSQSRTNNNVEGWHRGFLATCESFFPNIYKFVDCLKKQLHLHAYKIAQLTAGNLINRKNKKYKMISSRIQGIVEDFANCDLIDYLRGILYNYKF